MSLPPTKNCGTCDFAATLSVQTTQGPLEQLCCCRYAPAAADGASQRPIPWAPVRADWGCGDWQNDAAWRAVT